MKILALQVFVTVIEPCALVPMRKQLTALVPELVLMLPLLPLLPPPLFPPPLPGVPPLEPDPT